MAVVFPLTDCRVRTPAADYKGEFTLADRRYCFPLTISDFASRYQIACEALSCTQQVYAFAAFERAFQEFGLPLAIRTDNGVPFAKPNALYRPSKLAVRWLRLGIRIERIEPGHPKQDGHHERMHLTLKKEATKPAAPNLLRQQARFDDFIDRHNRERPHQALDMKYPAERCRPSPRPCRGRVELECPFHDRTVTVTHCGRICLGKREINLSRAFTGQNAGIKEVSDRNWLLTFMHYDLGSFGASSTTRSVDSNRSPTRSNRQCYPCLRHKPLPMSPEWTRHRWRRVRDSNPR